MLDTSRYKVHTYSLHPKMTSQKDITEAAIMDAFVALQNEWDNELEIKEHFGDPLRERKEYVSTALHKKDGVYVLVEDAETNRIVGMGELINEGNLEEYPGAYLSFAYVSPEYRTNKIYNTLIEERLHAAQKIGYTEVFSEPAQDGRSLSSLVKHGFVAVNDDPQNLLLRKELLSRKEQESPFRREGSSQIG